MDEDLEQLEERPLAGVRSVSWSAVVGGAFGLALGVVWVALGFKGLLVAGLLALVGGFLGRVYIGD